MRDVETLICQTMFTQCIPLRVTHCHQQNSRVRVCLELSFKKAEKCRVGDESAEDDEEIFHTFINHLKASVSHRSHFIIMYTQILLVFRILMLHVLLRAWCKRWTFDDWKAMFIYLLSIAVIHSISESVREFNQYLNMVHSIWLELNAQLNSDSIQQQFSLSLMCVLIFFFFLVYKIFCYLYFFTSSRSIIVIVVYFSLFCM